MATSILFWIDCVSDNEGNLTIFYFSIFVLKKVLTLKLSPIFFLPSFAQKNTLKIFVDTHRHRHTHTHTLTHTQSYTHIGTQHTHTHAPTDRQTDSSGFKTQWRDEKYFHKVLHCTLKYFVQVDRKHFQIFHDNCLTLTMYHTLSGCKCRKWQQCSGVVARVLQ